MNWLKQKKLNKQCSKFLLTRKFSCVRYGFMGEWRHGGRQCPAAAARQEHVIPKNRWARHDCLLRGVGRTRRTRTLRSPARDSESRSRAPTSPAAPNSRRASAASQHPVDATPHPPPHLKTTCVDLTQTNAKDLLRVPPSRMSKTGQIYKNLK